MFEMIEYFLQFKPEMETSSEHKSNRVFNTGNCFSVIVATISVLKI